MLVLEPIGTFSLRLLEYSLDMGVVLVSLGRKLIPDVVVAVIG